MERELEFRAWDTQFKTYTYSGWGEKTFSIFVKRTNCERYIIEQYTGLKDKNGKKIFEGDILERDNYRPSRMIVVWGISHWYCNFIDGTTGATLGHMIDPNSNKNARCNIKIIGNIHGGTK